MAKGKGMGLLALASLATLLVAMGLGSVYIPPLQTLNILLRQLTGWQPFGEIPAVSLAILWEMRLPRTLLAFLAGSGLAVSGVIMQSVLRNPLASSYTLGVSSGAALGASLAILLKISVLGLFTLQIFGLGFGLATVFLALGIAAKIDKSMQNHSIILTGMAISLFANAGITVIMSLAREELQRVVFWQLGSFALKSWPHAGLLLPVVLAGSALAFTCSREMDLLTLGEEQAQTSGVELGRLKWLLLSLGAVLTGAVVAMVGVIGFIDLFTPHAARKLFGSGHRLVLPASALMGGTFMVLCDLAARTIAAPLELPVGAITAILGAPFFLYLYFSRRRQAA